MTSSEYAPATVVEELKSCKSLSVLSAKPEIGETVINGAAVEELSSVLGLITSGFSKLLPETDSSSNEERVPEEDLYEEISALNAAASKLEESASSKSSKSKPVTAVLYKINLIARFRGRKIISVITERGIPYK